MISISIDKLFIATALALLLNACTETSGLAAGGTSIEFSAAASPSVANAQAAGAKTFSNDLGDSITLTRAYLVLTNVEVHDSCSSSFSVDAEDILNFFLPSAHAHTEATPTATGEPYVVDLLSADDVAIAVGSVSPPVGDYCGLSVNLLAADADTFNLPSAAGEPDLIGRTVVIEGSYTRSVANGGGSGAIHVSTGATLRERELALSPAISISRDSSSAELSLAIEYDSWFNAVDPAALEAVTANGTSPLDAEVIQLMQNISASIHQR